tara:strand:- start:207228 stop:208169 length:942 start_codon:yes stop_codon:yes gene_type:complete
MKKAGLILLGGVVVAVAVLFLDNSFTEKQQVQHAMVPNFSNEREFLEHMIPHHEEAISTAQEVLERGGTVERMVSLSKNIISTQTKEVAQMKENYQTWYGEEYVDQGVYMPMMRELESLSGEPLDRIFLHDMTMHHMGAIMMAQTVLPVAKYEEIMTLANAIIVNQSEEINLMRDIYREISSSESAMIEAKDVIATVYKSPTCGCCSGYVAHLQGKGYDVVAENTDELIAIKEQFGVPSELGSCHTMTIGGYVVEGHVPEEAVQKLLAERPPIKGIGMAGMPSGSPGMPGPKEEFAIYEINLDGTKGGLFMFL